MADAGDQGLMLSVERADMPGRDTEPVSDGSTSLVAIPETAVRGARVLIWVYAAALVGLGLLFVRHPPRLHSGWRLAADLLRACWLLALLAFVGFAIWHSGSQKRKSEAWIRDIAPNQPGLPPGGVAGVIAVNLGMSPGGMWMTSFDRVARAARACRQKVPWMWVDAAAVPLLAKGRRDGRQSVRLRRSSLWVRGLVAVLGIAPLAGALAYATISIALYTATPATLQRLGLAALAAWAAGAAAYALLPRFRLTFLDGRALLLRRGRVVRRLDPADSLVIITTCRARLQIQTGNDLGVRWWFLMPGLPNLYVNNLRVDSTPWSDQIRHAIDGPTQAESWPGACPNCGYPTRELHGARCPECGAKLASSGPDSVPL